MVIFLIFGISFLTLGVALYVMSGKVSFVSLQYNNICPAYNGVNRVCNLNFTVEQTMFAPIFAYYELSSFYQNHKRYVKSRNVVQLAGNQISMDDAFRSCEPIVTNANLGLKYAFDGVTELDPNAVAVPCGLIAKSHFNDTYRLNS